jgi:uncharacterized protein YndB with AHSA1/START domain
MSEITRARAVADLIDGRIVASVDIAAPPERVFRALASAEIVDWWVNQGVFDTREWAGEVRVGGWWRASGVARGKPYTLEGEFLEIDPPRTLVHTWHRVAAPGAPSLVTYLLEPIPGGTRLTVHHSGIVSPEDGDNTTVGWRTSFSRLAEILSPQGG